MSEPTPPASIIDDPGAPQRPSRAPAIIAWLIIIAEAAFLFIASIHPQVRGRSEAGATAGADAMLTMYAHLAVGERNLSKDDAGTLIWVLDLLARTPQQQLQAAVVAGELLGREAALKRLDSIAKAGLSEEVTRDLADLKTVYNQSPASLDSATRERLIARYQYIGELALVFGEPDSNPQKASVIKAGQRTVRVSTIAGTIVVLLSITGVALLLTAIVLLVTARLRRRYVPQPSASSVYIEMFAVYLTCYILFSLLLSVIFRGDTPLLATWLVGLCVPVTIGWGVFRGVGWGELRHSLGWHGGNGWYREIPLGVLGFIAGIPIVYCGLMITMVLIRFAGQIPVHPIAGEEFNSLWQILQIYSVASIFAPVVEETMFRGALFHHMRRRWNWIISAGVVAFIFAMIHPQGWTTIPALGSIAIVLAALREWRGSIIAPMVAHGCNNFAVMSLLIALR